VRSGPATRYGCCCTEALELGEERGVARPAVAVPARSPVKTSLFTAFNAWLTDSDRRLIVLSNHDETDGAAVEALLAATT
jgi:hypothetical protein